MSDLEFDKGEILYDVGGIKVTRNPQNPNDYSAHIEEIDNYAHFPRGTLKDIALFDLPRAKKSLEVLNPQINLSDSQSYHLIAVMTKVHWSEEKKREKGQIKRISRSIKSINQTVEKAIKDTEAFNL